MDPKPITATTEGPLNDLVFAVNHYLSTGDHICEGVGYDTETAWILALPVSRTDSRDQADFEKLKARLVEIGQESGIETTITDEHKADDRFFHYSLMAPKDRLHELTRQLMARPSPLGWGTGKPHMDQHWVSMAGMLYVARREGVWLSSVHPVLPLDIRQALAGRVDAQVLDVALQPTGETGQRVLFWRVQNWRAQNPFYLDDPTFSPAPVNIEDLEMDPQLGLRVRE